MVCPLFAIFKVRGVRRALLALFLVLPLLYAVPLPGGEEILFRQEFDDLEAWRPRHFPKIKGHTLYTAEKEGERGYLRAESSNTASGLVLTRTFDIYEYPLIRWRWRVDGVFEKGDAGTRAGDDYPFRVYVVFEYDPAGAGLGQRLKYGLARAFFGEYPPHSTLNYIWANREHDEPVITSAVTDRAKIIPLQAGEALAGQWVTEEVNALEDYRRAFGADPPRSAGLALMNDSDDTGEAAVSYLDFIEVYR